MKITNIGKKVLIVHTGRTYKRITPKEVMEIADKPGIKAIGKFSDIVEVKEEVKKKVIKKAPKKGLDKKLEKMED